MTGELRSFLLHLRIPFQMTLAPIFLWGALVPGGQPDLRLAVGFLLFHFSLCAGATLFNSYYDRDVGPIAWLKHPPPVSRQLRNGSLLLQATGLLLAPLVSPLFAILFLLLVLVGIAYSHPAIRIKRYAWRSLAVVTLAQGGGTFLAGFLSAGGELGSLGQPTILAALIASMLIPSGLFPITQVYQIEEDRERGDITFAVRYGPRVSFFFSGAALGLGAVIAALVMWERFHWIDGLLVFSGTLSVLLMMTRWARRFSRQTVEENHDSMAWTTGALSVSFLLLILARLFLFPVRLPI